ncbi:MAG: hypothetical protein QXQ81_02880 [Candidatus Thorarchaeota archaeon]
MRSDLVGIIRGSSSITEMIVNLIENELRDLREGDAAERVRGALSVAAREAGVTDSTRDAVLAWLTKTTPDVRQTILVQTSETHLGDDKIRPDILRALEQVASKESVTMVMDWVNRGILTLSQGVYVLLFPESSVVATD